MKRTGNSNSDSGMSRGQKFLIETVCFLIVMVLLLVGFFLKSRHDEEEAFSLASYQASVEAASKVALPTAAPALTEKDIEELFDSYRPQVTEVPLEGGSSSEGGAVSGETESTAEPEITDDSMEESMIEPRPVCPVDFESLWELNKDVYAWISVPGTVIDYPVLQHATDNSYYLNYNIDGSHGYPGCIYTENLNAKDFSDNNTVIYGHNMKNGTMFAGLHKFEDGAFFAENEDVFIYAPEATYEYTIFATYIYDDRHLLYSFDFANEDVYASYLEGIFSIRDLNAHFREGIEVTKEDNIITLVTCIGSMPNNRLLVQAVLDNIVYYEE